MPSPLTLICDLFLRLRGYTRCPCCGKLSRRTSILVDELCAEPRAGLIVIVPVNRVYCHRCGLYAVENTCIR